MALFSVPPYFSGVFVANFFLKLPILLQKKTCQREQVNKFLHHFFQIKLLTNIKKLLVVVLRGGGKLENGFRTCVFFVAV